MRRDLILVLVAAGVSSALFLGKAWNIDEPCFLAMGRHALVDPRHPLDFLFNWHGLAEPMSRVNPNPPLVPYLVAAALRFSAEKEWSTRLLLLPFDLMAAVGLYLLAARMLKKPLGPTLVVLLSPAWMLNVPMVAAEKWVAAFGLLGLAALVHGGDTTASLALSASLLALALLSKLSAAFLLVPAIAWLWRRGSSPRTAVLFAAAASLPAALVVRGGGGENALGIWRHTALAGGLTGGAVETVRAFLAFVGGCLLAVCAWPLSGRRPARPVVSGAAIAAAALFLPWFDAQPVRLLDRATGILFAFGAVLSFAEAARERPRDDETWLLWSWIAALSFLQLFVYWAVVSRYILFLTPPLAFVSARSLERRTNGRRLARVYAVSGALALLVSVALGDVDARFAGAQKEAAAAAVRLPRAPGARLWFTGHWGLQYYLEAAGATGLDRSRGGWDQVAPHDLVVVPATNANLLMPRRRLVGRTAVTSVGCFIPLRLMRTGSAGFYSSTFGFLPYALSRAPLDTFSLAEEF